MPRRPDRGKCREVLRDEAVQLSGRRSLVERAFELANSGDCPSLTAVKRRLSKEGYSDVHASLDGRLLRTQITEACRKSRASTDV